MADRLEIRKEVRRLMDALATARTWGDSEDAREELLDYVEDTAAKAYDEGLREGERSTLDRLRARREAGS